MKINTKKKNFLGILLAFILVVSVLQVKSLATDIDTIVVNQGNGEYLIYIDGMLEQNFKFSYSKTNEEQDLNYINAIKDNEGNYIAYVDEDLQASYFDEETTYMWIKVDDEVTVEGVKITLSDAVTEDELNEIVEITATMEAEAEAEDETITINGNEGETYYYQIDAISSSTSYSTLIALVDEINSSSTDKFTKIKDYIELLDLYNTLLSEANDGVWAQTTTLQIAKPYGATEDSQYILWLKDSEGNVTVQILTAYEKEVTEIEEQETTEEVTETTTTSETLPYTYDELTPLFVALGIIILAIAVILIIKIASKKASNEE